MNYPLYSQIISETFQTSHAIKVIISIPPSLFQAVNKSISDIHRDITNSKQSFANKTNRVFWKSLFSGGLYTYDIGKEKVIITYYLTPKKELTPSDITQLRLRIKKIIWSEVIIQSIQPEVEEEVFNVKQMGIRFIGQGHQKKMELQLA